MLTNERIRELMLANGFTIKEGLDDLKPYVYEAARAIEAEVRKQAMSDALEQAAKLCDAGAEQMLHAYYRMGAARCAAAIRKVKEVIQ